MRSAPCERSNYHRNIGLVDVDSLVLRDAPCRESPGVPFLRLETIVAPYNEHVRDCDDLHRGSVGYLAAV